MDDPLFDDVELVEAETVLSSDRLNINGGASTPETRARYAFLKTKRIGDCWVEGRSRYVMGKTGVTVLGLRNK